MRVFVAGASGVIGRQLVPLLTDAGHEVSALARDPARVPAGAQAVVGDALDRQSVIDAVRKARPDAIVHQLTAIPPGMRPRGMRAQMEPTNRLRIEGTANLIAAGAAAGVTRFVAQSIAFAYAPQGPSVAAEDAPLNVDAPAEFRDAVRAVAELERQVTEAGGVVLRYGWVYGPGTGLARDGGQAEMVRRRGFPVVGSGEGMWSFVHTRDAAAAAVAALGFEGPRIFNVVDDHPAPVREWLPELARLLGAPAPRRVPGWLARLIVGRAGYDSMTRQRGASNARARAELGWQPRYPDWRGGFAEELS